MSSKAIDLCNRLLDAVIACGTGCSTKEVFGHANIDDGSIGPRCRKFMNTMSENGILERADNPRGRGFLWSAPLGDDTDRSIIPSLVSAGRAAAKKSRSSSSERSSSGLAARVAELEAIIKSGGISSTITVKVGDRPEVELPDDVLVPKALDDVLVLCAARRPTMLIGPAGCGKTTIGELVAKSLDLPFYSISCTAGMSEVHLIGRGIPNIADGSVRFRGTDFLTAYENGGVFLMDEMDAADSNLLLTINSAIANGYMSVPDRLESPRAVKHDDFIMLCSANTYGTGPDRQYVGRFQLDAATLDRFSIGRVECDYDTRVEAALCPNPRLLDACWQVRAKIRDNNLRRIMSTRFVKDAYVMSQHGWSDEKCIDQYFIGWSADERARCYPTFQAVKTSETEKSNASEDVPKESGEGEQLTVDTVAVLGASLMPTVDFKKSAFSETFPHCQAARVAAALLNAQSHVDISLTAEEWKTFTGDLLKSWTNTPANMPPMKDEQQLALAKKLESSKGPGARVLRAWWTSFNRDLTAPVMEGVCDEIAKSRPVLGHRMKKGGAEITSVADIAQAAHCVVNYLMGTLSDS